MTTPELDPAERIRLRMQGLANRILRTTDRLDWWARHTRPETSAERWRRIRDEANRRAPR